jgi:hypothetical protein
VEATKRMCTLFADQGTANRISIIEIVDVAMDILGTGMEKQDVANKLRVEDVHEMVTEVVANE